MLYKFKIQVILSGLILIFICTQLSAQNSGVIWIKEFLPGSAKLSDPSIDQRALAFVDSLMQCDDIEVSFLGGADPTNWRLFGRRIKHRVSDAWDQAKKIERASALRQRYNRGQIGTTDKPIRGVKVIWGPKRPDIFKLQERLVSAETKIDSLSGLFDSLKLAYATSPVLQQQTQPIESRSNMDVHSVSESAIVSDWEVKTGFMVWSAGGPYDLSVPYMGLAFKRENWALEFLGGFTPWSQSDPNGNRGDALLVGSLHLFPRSLYELKVGFFSGWEFLSKSDVWTMKIMGLTVGPKLRWKIFETYLGYTFGKLRSLTEEHWCSGGLVTMSLHLKLY